MEPGCVSEHRRLSAPVSGKSEAGPEGELSRFVEEAVRAHILGVIVEQAQAQNAHLSEDAIIDAVGEALAWRRRA
jgi:hypothetical protein